MTIQTLGTMPGTAGTPDDLTARSRTDHTARTAGLLYVTIIVCGLFAEIVVRTRLIDFGDPAATAANIIGSPGLFRAGVAADLVMLLCDVAIAVVLFRLFEPVSRTLAMLAAAFRLTQAAVLGFNLLGMFGALRLLTDAEYVGAFPTEQVETLALLALDAHRYGYVLGLAFFGAATLAVAALARKSGQVPRLLTILLALAGAGYLADTAMFFLVAGYDGALSPVVLAPALIAEIWFAAWLLFRGDRRLR